MEEIVNKFEEKLKELLVAAKKKKNVIEYQDIPLYFSGIELDEEKYDKILETLDENNVDVLRISDNEDDTLLIKEDDEEEEKIEEVNITVLDGVNIEDHVRMYLKEIGKVSLLSAEEEVELAKKMEIGDENAKKRLAEANLRLVVSIAKRYVGRGILG